MREVARRSGVSPATVSYVVNGGPRPVSRELRDRVLAAMRELGYQRGHRGRARSRPLLIGVVVPDATNLFFSRAIAAIEASLRADGHLVVSASTDGDPERERALVTTFARQQADGLIVTPATATPTVLEELGAGGLPVVLLDWDEGPTCLHRVLSDNYRSTFQATRLLIESGHRRIALVNGPQSAAAANGRLRGYRDALASARIPPVEPLISGPFTGEQGRRATLELLSRPERPEAILSASVLLTLGVVQALHERRLRWPDDIALIGYGDPRLASLVTPPLTMIEQPVDQLGEAAVQLLLGARAGRAPGQRLVLDCNLVVRESHWRVGSTAA
jgi:LacI family transcriptional regulator